MNQISIREFMRFTGIVRPEEFRQITRAHVIAWRKTLMAKSFTGATIRAKLAALSSSYQYLCDKHAVPFNPVKGVSRPKIDSYEGKTPAISDAQVRALLTAPKGNGIKAKRGRAILYRPFLPRPAPRRIVRDESERPPRTPRREAFPASTVRARNRATYQSTPAHWAPSPNTWMPPATAVTNALDQGADIAKVQEWLGHANVSTTRVYDHRKTKPEDSPMFKVSY